MLHGSDMCGIETLRCSDKSAVLAREGGGIGGPASLRAVAMPHLVHRLRHGHIEPLPTELCGCFLHMTGAGILEWQMAQGCFLRELGGPAGH